MKKLIISSIVVLMFSSNTIFAKENTAKINGKEKITISLNIKIQTLKKSNRNNEVVSLKFKESPYSLLTRKLRKPNPIA